MSKPTIYVDFDNTMVNTTQAICDLYNKDFKYYSKFTPIDYTDVKTYEFSELQCASSEIINFYFNTKRLFKHLRFYGGCLPALRKLHNYGYEIVIVSHGYRPNAKLKKKFIKKYIPFADFIWVDLKYHKDKASVDMSDGIFIDDDCKNLDSSNAKYKICFGEEYDWNKNDKYKRCRNWFNVFNYLFYEIPKEEC